MERFLNLTEFMCLCFWFLVTSSVIWFYCLVDGAIISFLGQFLMSPKNLFFISGLGAYFNCPVIALSTFSTSKWTNDLTKAPNEYSYVAHNFIKFSENMNFYERTLNTLTSQYENIFMEMVHYERQVR